jgi:Tfp pilus assembly protein PilW
MLALRRECRQKAGFSLAEALVALAIATILVAILTRFVSGTRETALQIHEDVAMEMLSESLLDRLVVRQLQPGRIFGRNGALLWHVDVAPIAFYAQARSVAEKKAAAVGAGTGAATAGTSAGPGAVGASFGQGTAVGLTTSSTEAPNKRPQVVWSPHRVSATVISRSGQSYAIDTIRIVQQKSEPASARTDQP